jgi:uncharacterized OB-fold protein
MTESAVGGAPRPAVPYLKILDSGDAYLEGHRCRQCREIYLGARRTCSRCFARDQMDAIRLADRGTLYNFTIVYRNFPGVKVPFVSAIVDLEGGGTVRGNLVDVEPDPAHIAFDMPVEVVYRDAGRTDKDGNRYLAYFFVPAGHN